jgi:hypothetical protein
MKLTVTRSQGSSVWVWLKRKLSRFASLIEKGASVFLVLVTGAKEKSFMKKKTNSSKQTLTDKPKGKLKRVGDFLPPPDQLLPKDETQKITLVLDCDTVE